MAIINPTQLVDEFKKSGEFDRLRRELLSQFRDGEGLAAFMARVEDITRQKLASDQKLQYMSDAAASRELMQELDRYPIVQRAVAEVPALSDPTFSGEIRDSVRKILLEDRKGPPQSSQPDANAPAAPTDADGEMPMSQATTTTDGEMSMSQDSTTTSEEDQQEDEAKIIGENEAMDIDFMNEPHDEIVFAAQLEDEEEKGTAAI